MPIVLLMNQKMFCGMNWIFKKWKMPDNMDCLLRLSMSPGIYKHKSYYL